MTAKLQALSVPLELLVEKFSWGTSISGFKTYKISESKYAKLNAKQKLVYRKVIQTADIKRYGIEWQKEYVDASIYSPAVTKYFNQEKIVIARLTKTIQATLDKENYYMGKSSFIVNPKMNAKYLIALLNSTLLNYFFFVKFVNTHLAGGYLRFDIPYLEKLPIAKASVEKEKEIIKLVDQLLLLNQQKAETKLATQISQLQGKINYCEDKINELVYKLYDLTEEEIKIVEGK